MYHIESNARLPKTGNYCSEAAERFAFAALSTAKAKSFISAYSEPLAKRAVNAQAYDSARNLKMRALISR